MRSPTLRTVTAGTVVGALAAAIGTAVLGVVLAGTYQPSDTEPWSLPLDAQRDLELLRWHTWAAGAFLVGSVVTAVLVPWATGPGRRILMMTGSLFAVVAAAVTALTRPLVEWDQLAVYSVTDGSGLDGYWTAAFGERVRFVIVDGTEISQGEYAVSVLVHLGAPVLGAVALLAVTMGIIRRSGPWRAAATPPAPTS